VLGRVGPRPGRKVVLNRFDYVSLAEESDFYIVDFFSDEKEQLYFKARPDALDLRWQDPLAPNLDPKPRPKRAICLKFHDGALAGTKIKIDDKDRFTIGISKDCDIVIPSGSSGETSIAPVHASISYERGFWYIEDHSSS